MIGSARVVRFCGVLLAMAVCSAQETAPAATPATPATTPPAHKRPERGDAMPELELVDAANNQPVKLVQELATGDATVPLFVVFLHHDKDLCVRFVQELGTELDRLGEPRSHCRVLLVFSGDAHDGPVVASAQHLPAPVSVCWDKDRSAYTAMGLIAFPTVYFVDRGKRTIEVVRRGYKVSLAQEVVARTKLGLGLMTAEDYARLDGPSSDGPIPGAQRTTELRQAQQLLRNGKPEAALPLFEKALAGLPGDPEATAGRAVAAGRLGRPDAYDMLVAAQKIRPDDSAVTLGLAELLLQRDRAGEAETLIKSVLDKDPAPAWYLLGRVYEQQAKWKEAAQAYRESASRLLR